jgi:hypothetical protein
MGRPRGSRNVGGTKPAKRKKVTVRIIKEKHAGEVTEPHQLLSEICRKEHGHLDQAKIGLAWRSGWRSDTDGHMKLGQCKKSSDLDREMYAGFDFVILLNEEAWPRLSVAQKRALIDHELCHAALSMDANGEPKYNDRDRLCCRIKKHDVEEFRCIVERHGLYTQDLADIAVATINDAKRPLLPENTGAVAGGNVATKAETADATANEADDNGPAEKANNNWRRVKVEKLGLQSQILGKLLDAGVTTLGKLSDTMNAAGVWWRNEIKGIGDASAEKIADAFAFFWESHPEYTQPEKADGEADDDAENFDDEDFDDLEDSDDADDAEADADE